MTTEDVSTVRDVGSLTRFGVTKDGGLRCLACSFAGDPDEVAVPGGYHWMLAWLVRMADEHNRVVHSRVTAADPQAEHDAANRAKGFPWCDTCEHAAVWSEIGGWHHSTPDEPFGHPAHSDPFRGHLVTTRRWASERYGDPL